MDAAGLLAAGAGAGLLAGATSCAAVQLGLLTGAVRGASRPGAPVAAFLSARLAVHAALGAVLGLTGGAVQPGPRARGVLLALAAVVLALFALDLLGLRPARRLLRRGADGAPHCAPAPAPDLRPDRAPPRVRRPAVLGAATVLVPCGLTLSAELLAVTSRSPLGGAAVMTGFVLGTAPLSALAGVALGRTMALLRGRLTALLGVALLAVSAWTLLSGLRLGGWLPDGSGSASADAARFVRTDSAGTQVVTVWALDQGYRPSLVEARAGRHTVLELRTRGTRGHTRAFTVPARNLDVVLPADGVTRIDLGAPGPGRLRFVCASGHYPGAITFR
ncbi:urease accessory protein UreH domain-containing protein [Actinomadura macrotermitis]|uniref:Sulfite exporter TauE/SafE family protein n=1 Tax=Actinomadura macrotermitis TaxID=2585200 RepID=A0A7K0BLN9_9ACTN|nr:sulfite exporter TauE/SafE family protein [Actinomadura macrotermitis]MQY01986.1 hypothetical protein [Actinomadura macrotermitis]